MHPALAPVCVRCEVTGCGRRRWRNPAALGNSRKAHRARQAQGRSLPWAAEGGGGSASAECHGLAVLPQYREAESTGYFAPQIPSLVGSSSGQDRIRVVATRRKTRPGRTTPPLLWETIEAERVIKRPKGLGGRRPIVPNGREARHRTGRRGRKAPPFLFLRIPFAAF